ncbi:hypothetical protein [Clostridium cibarium]|nr:hypothetical protein [Clostridium cibarium]
MVEAEKMVRKLFNENDFIWIDCNLDYESDTRLFDNINRFTSGNN